MENNQKYCTLYIVRHGQSLSNIEKIVAGHTDKDLTPNGEEQARERAKKLAPVKFDLVFSSDLMRAKRTAEIISINRQLEINTTHLLRERNFGEWEGRGEKEFRDQNVELFEKLKEFSEENKQQFKVSPGYESNQQIAIRLITFLRELSSTYPEKTILIVSHGSIMRSLLMHLGFATYDSLPSGSIENMGYFILESDGVDFFVKETVGINKVAI